MDHAGLSQAVAALLVSAGIGTAGLRIEPCAGGGNNRVFRVDAGGRAMVAKCYFRHPSDTRDRLNSEYSFLEYARKAGIDCVPGAIGRDDRAGFALYEFIAGSKLQADAPSVAQVGQARDFFVKLNAAAARVHGESLPDASEACFSIAAQLQMVQGRIDRLAGIPAASPIDAQGIAFAAELGARWATLREQVHAQFVAQGIDPQAPLAGEDRCISPSDFGFHNAIVTSAGRVFFIDFEYAGWDDPAKAVSDFFSHPAVVVPFECFDEFLSAALKYSRHPAELAQRTRLLLPVFRIKWCCIVMNDFLPRFGPRRFADPAGNAAARKQGQLDKARRLLQSIH